MAEATVDDAPTPIDGPDSTAEIARAKINLCLHILGRRADGYHQIDSLAVFAEVSDSLRLTPHTDSGIALTFDGRFASELAKATRVDENIVLKAARMLQQAVPAGSVRGARLGLTKHIPVAAGLGGGSADAAAALRLLNRTWKLGLDHDRLAEISVRLGADVPICLLSRAVRAQGIGERITTAGGIPTLPIVLLNPGRTVVTKNVFGRLIIADGSPIPPIPRCFGSVIEFTHWLSETRNDLYDAAVAEEQTIAEARRALGSDPDCLIARMSGSGATMFGVFATLAAAGRAARRLQLAQPDWWVVATTTGGSEDAAPPA